MGVDINRHVIQLDEVMSQHRNPIRVGDTVAVTGSITGTPIVFKTRVLAIKVVDGSTLYECAIPDEMTYEQQRAQFRLELGAASRAEASITKEGKKYRGKISDISELGAAFRLRRGVPIEKGDCIDHVEFNLTSKINRRLCRPKRIHARRRTAQTENEPALSVGRWRSTQSRNPSNKSTESL